MREGEKERESQAGSVREGGWAREGRESREWVGLRTGERWEGTRDRWVHTQTEKDRERKKYRHRERTTVHFGLH